MKLVLLILLISLIFVSCSTITNTNDKVIQVIVAPSKEYQVMEGFGASDCWSVQFVGENWPIEKKEAIADLLFSKEFDVNGNPVGIGLSQWRFNIGGGTAEQEQESKIPNPWRRAECFRNNDGSYDWGKQAGQQWFMHAAKKRGVEKLLAFTNTPPVYFTKNNKGWSPGGDHYNIQTGKIADYADFLVHVCRYFKHKGIGFDYISPFNEPQWDWKAPATQEGTPAINQEIAKATKILSVKLKESGLTTEIAIPEAAQIQFLYEKRDEKYSNRDNQINVLFNDSSDLYVGNISNVKKTVMGHSYFTTNNLDTLIAVRERLRDHIQKQKINLNYWQSEFCILENHKDIGGGNHRDLGMATALYVARVIHADLAYANASLWSWWTALTAVDYKDGLIYLDRGDEKNIDQDGNDLLQKDGFFRESKLLWVLGNYSHFVHPGMVRIQTKLNNPKSLKYQLEDLMITGYKSTEKDTYVFVLVNYSNEDKELSFSNFCKDNNINKSSLLSYTTSAAQNLEKGVLNADKIIIKGKSVVTILANK